MHAKLNKNLNHTSSKTTTLKKSDVVVNKIFSELQRLYPNPKTELYYINHFTLLVAIVLSAQSTDVSVNKVTVKLFKIANSPSQILALGETELKKHIKTIGLFNTKAKNIILLCQQILTLYHGEIPNELENLVKLPGVGRKTANVFLNVAHNQPTIAVDTHVFRVANRLGLTHAKNPLQSESQLLTVVPKPFLLNAHILLILHGRYTCKAQKPLCKECSLQPYCDFYQSGKKIFIKAVKNNT